ncbi:MAG: hypothetical protein JWN29_683 [Acidimicrobiales bacterium]|nr:hypothetical protein [Acidimicrobiales bacterium]
MLRVAFALTAVLLLAACRGGASADVARDDRGRASQAGTVRADKLRVGDCFEDQDDQSPDGFPVVPCARAHANEAYARFKVPGGDYPGQDALTEIATGRCTAEPFTDYVGRPYDGSALDVFYALPSKETWDRFGDRIVVCALFAKDLSPLTGSMEGSAR